MNIIEGNYNCLDYKFAVIVSKFNEFIGQKLLEGTLECLRKHNCPENNIDIIKVPGAFEIPVIASKLAGLQKYNAIITLGAVIRGETPHFDYVAGSASAGIIQVSLKYNVPVIFGVLTTDNVEQAIARAEPKSGNKGWNAALTAIEMADLMNKF